MSWEKEALFGSDDRLTFGAYEAEARETAIYPSSHWATYPGIGLASEVGELLGLLKRRLRDGADPDPHQIRAEIGDVLWYLAEVARVERTSLSECAAQNLRKLKSRQRRGALGGSGGDR